MATNSVPNVMCAPSPGVAVILISTMKLTIRSNNFSQVREPVKYLCRIKSDKVVSHKLHDFSQEYLRSIYVMS